ncbi:MAG: glutaminyl-peptide cyclotransferase, partial [Bacteroidota bacterium]
MSDYKIVLAILSLCVLANCASNSIEETYGLSLKTSSEKNTITLGESVQLSINNPNAVPIASVNYALDGKTIEKSVTFSSGKLGKRKITATIKHGDKETVIDGFVKVLNNKEPEIYTYEIVNTYPHDITSYTQGLEFYNGELYESTGQYNESKLRKVDYATGEVLKNVNLSNGFFGEGLTILNNNIYQLTWQEDT